MAGGEEEKTLVRTTDSDSLSHFLLSFERLSVRKRAAIFYLPKCKSHFLKCKYFFLKVKNSLDFNFVSQNLIIAHIWTAQR